MMRRFVVAIGMAWLFTGGRVASAQNAEPTANEPAAPSAAPAPVETPTPAPIAPPAAAPAAPSAPTQEPLSASPAAGPSNTPPIRTAASNTSAGTALPYDWLIVHVGAGLSSSTIQLSKFGQKQQSPGVSLYLDLGVRLHRYVGLGVHLGKSTGSVEMSSGYDEMHPSKKETLFRKDYDPLEFGVTLSLHPLEWLWVAPWIGTTDFPVRASDYDTHSTQSAYGVGIGTDFATGRQATHRLGAYLSFTQSGGFSEGEGVRGYTVGLSYRYK